MCQRQTGKADLKDSIKCIAMCRFIIFYLLHAIHRSDFETTVVECFDIKVKLECADNFVFNLNQQYASLSNRTNLNSC